MRFAVLVLAVVAPVALIATVSCGKKGASGTTPSLDGGTTEACMHALKDLPDEQQKVTVAAATRDAMTRMAELEPGGRALVACPLDGTPTRPRAVVAHCGGVRTVMWSTGSASATSYFDVSGKLSAYQESAGGGYTCSDGHAAAVAVYGSVPTCQPWTEERYCSPTSTPPPSP